MTPLYVRLGLQSKEFAAGMLQAQKDLKKMKDHTEYLSSSLSNLKKIAVSAFAGWGVIEVSKYILQASIEMDRFKRSMTAATGGVSQGKEAIKFLSEESNRLGLVFREQVKGFQQLAAAAKGTKISYGDIKEAYLGISEASTVMQLSQEQNKFALYALQQMISKGVVTMEEMRRQLGDQIPGAFQIAARAMHMTTSELIDTISTGDLLSEVFIPRFAKQMRKEFAGSAVEASQTAYGEINRLKNAFYELSNTIMSGGAMDAFTQSIREFNRAITSENFKRGIEDFAKNLFSVAQALAEIMKYASLRSVIGTWNQIIDLHKKGLITTQQFSELANKGFLERQRLLDDILDKQNKIAQSADILAFHGAESWIAAGGINKEDNFNPRDALDRKKWWDDYQRLIDAQKDLDHLMTEYYEALSDIDKKLDDVIAKEFSWLDSEEKRIRKINKTADEARKEYYNERYKYYQDAWMPERFERLAEERTAAETRAIQEIIDKEKELAEERKKIYENFISNIQSMFADTFEDIFSGNITKWQDMMETMRKIFIKTLAEMAAAALTKKITANINVTSNDVGLGNLFGNPTYNYIGSGVGGAAAGYNAKNWQQGAMQGAMAGATVGGGWGALIGAAAGGIMGSYGGGGDKKKGFKVGENYISGLSGSLINKGFFIPQYHYLKGPKTEGKIGSPEGIQWQNQLVDAKNKFIKTYQDILHSVPKDLAESLKEEASKINVQWQGEYGQDLQTLSQTFIDKYNTTLMGAIGADLEKYVKGQKGYGLLGEYAQSGLVKPFLTAPGETQSFATAEEALQAIKYLQELEKTWRDITLTSKEATGQSIAYKKGINAINDSFDNMTQQLYDLGVSEEKIQEIENRRQKALDEYAKQAKSQRNSLMTEWKVLAGSITDYRYQMLNLKVQYIAAKKSLKDLGASTEEITLLTELYNKAVKKSIEEQQKKINDILVQWMILTKTFSDQEAALYNLNQQYKDALQSLKDMGASAEDIQKLKDLYGIAVENLLDSFADQLVESFKRIGEAWNNFYDSVMTDLAPVQSSAYYGSRLSQLVGGATTEEGINSLMSFVTSEYLPFMKNYGGSDYNTLWSSIVDLIGNMNYQGSPISSYGNLTNFDPYYKYTNDKIVIQIGNKVIGEILLSELKSHNPELIKELRRILRG